MKLFLLTCYFSLLTFFNSCHKDEPCVTCPQPGQDTTSHAFSFQRFTWGGGGGSSIDDVAIISDTDIWAVGRILLPDSVGKDSLGHNPPFGAVHWDGKEWQLLRLPTSLGITFTDDLEPSGIIAFSATDIWLASGGGVHRFDGKRITNSYWLMKFPGNNQGGILDDGQSSEKLWGTSSNSLYAVGRGGGLAWYNGSVWQKVNSGTSLDLHNIYGATDSRTGEQQILAVGSSNIPFDRIILRIRGTSVTTVSSTPIQFELFGLWFVPNQHYYVVGSGIFEKNSLADTAWRNNPLDITRYTTWAARGNGLNDLFVVGGYGECLHWNGVSWYSYRSMTAVYGGYASVAVRGNFVLAGGYDSQDALVVMGRRQ